MPRLFLIPVLLGLSLFLENAFAKEEIYFFAIQKGTPVSVQNFVQAELGCNWSGVGGQVFDRFGTPLRGLVVKLNGTLEGKEILTYAITGGEQQFGPGGYLIKFADHPVSSNSTLQIQFLDVSGEAKTPPIVLRTYQECSKNLLLLNIREIPFSNLLFFPVVGR